MFRSRLLTALVAVPLVLLVVFYFSELYFTLAMLVVTGLGAWEWSRLNGFTNIFLRILYVIAVFAGVYGAIFISEEWFFAIAAITVLWSSVAVILYQMNKSPAGFQWPFVRVISGIILLSGFCWASIFLRTFPFPLGGSWLLFYVMLLIWITDTAGYFVGRILGRHLMIPRVSPKKTWEGLAGSLFFGFLLAVLFSAFMMIINASYGVGYFSFKLVLLSFLTVVFAVPGDLFISVLKRQVGVKDSGVIFPGHGGMLDRIDSLIAGAIIFVFGIIFFFG